MMNYFEVKEARETMEKYIARGRLGEVMKRLKKAMLASNLKASMQAFKELCSLKSDEYAVDKWNCLHMEIHPRWPQNVAMGE